MCHVQSRFRDDEQFPIRICNPWKGLRSSLPSHEKIPELNIPLVFSDPTTLTRMLLYLENTNRTDAAKEYVGSIATCPWHKLHSTRDEHMETTSIECWSSVIQRLSIHYTQTWSHNAICDDQTDMTAASMHQHIKTTTFHISLQSILYTHKQTLSCVPKDLSRRILWSSCILYHWSVHWSDIDYKNIDSFYFTF